MVGRVQSRTSRDTRYMRRGAGDAHYGVVSIRHLLYVAPMKRMHLILCSF